MRYVPALDGLRGVAVAAVVGFHAVEALGGDNPLRGGFLGVSLFFTLSGYLITSLLLAEHRRTGSFAFGSFWARRFRRLSPAAFAVIAVCVAVPVFWDGAWGSALPAVDVLAALASVSNIAQIHQVDVAAAVGALPLRILGPLGPYWSLAVEEQFYLAISFLFVVVVRTRRPLRNLAVVFAVVAAVSVAVGLTVDGRNVRWLFATDVRAVELVAGCLLAVWSSPRPGSDSCTAGGRRTAPRAVPVVLADVVGAAGGAIGVVACLTVSEGASVVERGLFPAAAVVNAAILVGALHGRLVPRVLSWRPLVELGRVSYCLYLVHWPVILILRRERVGVGGAPLVGVQLLVAVILAFLVALSVERPIHLGGRLPAPRFAVAWVVSAVSLVLAAVAVEHARG